MNNKVRSALALVVMLPWTLGAAAEGTTSAGEPDCGEWISQPSPWQKSWLLGYLSGMNVMWNTDKTRSPRDPLGAISSGGQAAVWMDNYCRKNPLEKVSVGAVVLFSELVKKKRESQ